MNNQELEEIVFACVDPKPISSGPSDCSASFEHIPDIEAEWVASGDCEWQMRVGPLQVGHLRRSTGRNPYRDGRIMETWAWYPLTSEIGMVAQAMLAVVRKQDELNRKSAGL